MIAISGSDVHVWWLSLASDKRRAELARNLLQEEERARADRYHFARDRHRFSIARGLLRTILGEYTGEEPACLSLRLGPEGKPFLTGRSDIHFNLSHCEDRGVLAVASRPVGVDLEKLRRIPEALAIAENLFTASEMRALSAFPEARRSEGFLRCWTRKEAFVKARGGGLSTPLDSFEVTLEPDSARLCLLEDPRNEAWRLHVLEPGSGWVGALATDLGSARVVPRDWPPRP